MKCVEIWRNTGGEGGPLDKLDTLVVHAVNDVNLESVPLSVGSEANAIS